MRISGIKQGLPFKALHILDEGDENIKKVVEPNKKELEEMAKGKSIFISKEDAVLVQGSDYTIYKPVINVEILPEPVQIDKNKMEIKERYNTVLGASFVYVPSTANEKANKFMDIMKKSISLIG